MTILELQYKLDKVGLLERRKKQYQTVLNDLFPTGD